jgi:hypothetical protein
MTASQTMAYSECVYYVVLLAKPHGLSQITVSRNLP